ncbi:MAG: single-stranded DNA-binding protein [Acidobacteriaceae bacterium]|nr:single-stranded DNA-binding protein [Acidobacteriaceae bacterium]
MAERSINKSILIGRAGDDAETFHTQSGTPVSRVSLAMNRQWTDADNQVHEATDWIPVVIWNRENLASYVSKGSRLYVEGRLQTRSYDDKEGITRYVTEVIAQKVLLLGGNGNGNGHQEKSEQRPKPGRSAPHGRTRKPEPENDQITDQDVPF